MILKEPMESEQKARSKLEKTIQELDEIYEDQKIEHENMQQQLLNKVFIFLKFKGHRI